MNSQVVTWAGNDAAQLDGSACGSASLVYVTALGDPHYGAWLNGGHLDDRAELPPEIPRWARHTPPAYRREIAQRVMRQRLSAAMWPRWPIALGTHPLAAARIARFGDYRFRVHHLATHAAWEPIWRALRRGVPSLLYVGGGRGERWWRQLPRHVVVIHRAQHQLAAIYEPASALRWTLPPAQLPQCEPARAFGGWTRPYLAVIADITEEEL
ncbi:MAG: hypothetical protein Q4Q03_06195 [Bowdeniella nasicola]|nr:hypothetical protein [Bowdeniella nasicola]